jgi:hypothetical protein
MTENEALTMIVGDEVIDAMATLVTLSYEEIIKETEESGQIMQIGREPVWGVVYGDGSAHAEVLAVYDPTDPDSFKRAAKMIEKSDVKTVEWWLSINSMENSLSFEESALKAARPHVLAFVKYMKRIKRAFDPGNMSDPAFYVSPEEYE